MAPEHGNAKDQHLEVMIVTTSGTWPESGSERVPSHQKVRVELEKASKHLHITNTTGWIATVSGRAIDIEKSYQENGLAESIVIDYGPSEGGGGCE
jgi:hypothetical protein